MRHEPVLLAVRLAKPGCRVGRATRNGAAWMFTIAVRDFDRTHSGAVFRVPAARFHRARGSPIARVQAETGMLADARQQFLQDYARIRSAEGRGSDESAITGRCPSPILRGKFRSVAHSRAHVPLFRASRPYAPALEGAGSGCRKLLAIVPVAELRHQPVAVDIFADSRDGLLGAALSSRFPLSKPISTGFLCEREF